MSFSLRRTVGGVAAAAAFSLLSTAAFAAVEIGKVAPDFTAKDITGKEVSLSDFKGKNVVLEWNNPKCPFVKKFYSEGNMQELQKKYTGQDVVWLSINSGAQGKQGYMTDEQAAELLKEEEASPTAYIRDESGTIGNEYGAKTTPHMFVIDKEGKLAYMGAIDDNDSPYPEDIEGANNYVEAALSALEKGEPVEVSSTAPYGCSVKYSN